MTMEAQQVFQLVSLLAVLALFIAALRREQNYKRWFRGWEAERKARRDAELSVGQDPRAHAAPKRGPWG